MRPRAAQITVALCCLLVIAPSLFFTSADPDIWFHLKIGLEHLSTGALPMADHFSYGMMREKWISHEWLSRLLFGLAYGAGGITGLSALRILLVLSLAATLFTIAYRHLRQHVPLILLFMLCWQFLAPYLKLRTQIFSLLLFALLVMTLRLALEGRKNALWALPCIALAWANLHGGFFLLPVALLCALLEKRAATAVSRKQVAAFFVLSILLTGLNPFGYSLHAFVLEQFVSASNHAHVSEWAPLDWPHFPYFLLLSLVPVSLAIGARNSSRFLVALFVCLGAATVSAMRFFPFFSITSLILSCDMLQRAFDRVSPESPSRTALRRALEAPAVVAVLFAVLLIHTALLLRPEDPARATNPLAESDSFYPRHAVSFLQERFRGGNIALPFYWGGYVIWHLGDRFKVSADGRNITAYDPRYFAETVNGYRAGDLSLFLSAPQNPDFALVEKGSPIFERLDKAAQWRLVYERGPAAVFEAIPPRSPLRSPLPPQLPRKGDPLL